MQATATMLLALLSLAALAAGLLTFDEADARERPVTKVLSLLQGMKDQLDTEAKEEAELKEKYECWCKENGDKKAANVEAAQKRLKEDEARVSELTATSSRLKVEYANIGEDLDKDEASMDKSMALRKEEVAEFQAEEKDLLNSLNSVNSATAQIVPTAASFLQMPQHKAVSHTLQSLLARHASQLSKETSAKASAFLQSDPSTGGVQGVLDGLKGDFERKLADLQGTETENKAAYEKLIKAKRKAIDSAKMQIAAKKEQQTAADEEKMHLKEGIKDTSESMAEDLAFAKEVKEKCGGKAKEWEKRQKTRAEETEAVSKAIEVLGAEDAHAVFGKTLNPSFLQVSSSDDSARRDRASEALAEAGRKHDQRLVTLAMETKLDGFTRVTERIDGMITALKKEQADEVKKKTYCKEEFQQNRLATDKKKRTQESLSASMEELGVKLQTASDDVQALKDDIEEVKKQQQLAAQNREKENGEFQRVVQEQRQTQELLKKALNVLGEFYNKPEEESLIQKANPKEPTTFGGYKKSSSSNGVMMMLQQLIADAEEMEKESSFAERESQADYEEFGKQTIKTLETKNKQIADKAEAKAKAEKKLVETRESKEGVEAEVESLEGTNFELHETCDFTMQNFDARQKARGEEVEALNQAKSYLSGAKL